MQTRVDLECVPTLAKHQPGTGPGGKVVPESRDQTLDPELLCVRMGVGALEGLEVEEHINSYVHERERDREREEKQAEQTQVCSYAIQSNVVTLHEGQRSS